MRKIYPIIVGLLLLTSAITSARDLYTEFVNFHLGRDMIIAGEPVYFKAYCHSNSEKGIFYSKVLYVELINSAKQNCLSQILYINDHTASSYLQIPDTLSSGLYYLKGYTQWMKNFGESIFASEPIFIFNQHDENAQQNLSAYRIDFQPEIYISGGKLIGNIENHVRIKIPGLFGNRIGISLEENNSGENILTETTGVDGSADFYFVPGYGRQYSITVHDSVAGRISVALPLPEYSGSMVKAGISDKNELWVQAQAAGLTTTQLACRVLKNGSLIGRESLNTANSGVMINTGIVLTPGIYTLLLLDSKDKLISEQNFSINLSDAINLGSSGREYTTREDIRCNIHISELDVNTSSGISVSIHKLLAEGDSLLTDESGSRHIVLNELPVRYYPDINLKHPLLYPSEDMGIVYSGRISNSNPDENLTVLLSLNDSTAVVKSSNVDNTGNFSFLLNQCEYKNGNLYVLKRGVPSPDQQIETDEKFFYRHSKPLRQEQLTIYNRLSFISAVKDEAQRVLIEKAFGNIRIITDDQVFIDQFCIKENFYGDPDLKVYPGDFFYLPNFEEISREILPRVKYRHTRGKCDLSIFDVDENTVSNNPLVLIDGSYVTNPRMLYDLTSDQIRLIEIKSGMHISGQMIYEGLLAVSTTKAYQQKNRKSSDYLVPGYSNNNNEYMIVTATEKMKSNIPFFANQLYWNPMSEISDTEVISFNFLTSDDIGFYTVSVKGIGKNGSPVEFNRIFKVNGR